MTAALPTFWQVARRPRSLGILAACLLVAVIFSLLGQWQIGRAVEQGQGDDRDTETAVALESVAEPQEPMLSDAGGRVVTVEGTFAADGYVVLQGRQQDGVDGWWVTGRLMTADASLAVALGWAATEDAALAAVADLEAQPAASTSLTGRYVPTEQPTEVERSSGRETMSVPWLINVWPDYSGDVYAGYLIDMQAPESLEAIPNGAPVTDTQLNWLNVFYAIEWVVFALFAFYLWYRLVQDARERDIEAIDEAASDAEAPADAR